MALTFSFCSKEKLTHAMLDGMGAYISRSSERPYERFDFYDTPDFALSEEGAVLYVHAGKLSYADKESSCGASLKNPDKPVSLSSINASPLKKLLSEKLGEAPLSRLATASFRVLSFSIVEDKKSYSIRVTQRQSANSRAGWFYHFESDNQEAMRLLHARLAEKGFIPCPFYSYLLSFVRPESGQGGSSAKKTENTFFKYILRQAATALESFSDTGDMDSLLAGSACMKALLLPKPRLYEADKTADFAQELWDCARGLSGLSLLENAGVSEEALLAVIAEKREEYTKKLAGLAFPDAEEVSLPENAAELLAVRLKKMRLSLKKAYKKAKKKRNMKSLAAVCPPALDAACNISFISGEAVDFSTWRALFAMMLAADLKKTFKKHKKTIKTLLPAPSAEEMDSALKNTRKLLKRLKSDLQHP